MKLLRRLDVRITLLMLLVVLVAAIVQSAVSIVFIIRIYNEYSMEILERQWGELNRQLAVRECQDARCMAEAASLYTSFDAANPAFITDLDGNVLVKLPQNAPVQMTNRFSPRETMGHLFIDRSPDGRELAFVRGDLGSAGKKLGYIYVFQYPVEEAGGIFGILELYAPVVSRSVVISLAVSAVLAITLVGFLTRRLRKLTEAVEGYDPKQGLPRLGLRGHDEIATLAHRFEDMAGRIASLIGELELADQSRRQLIAGIGHDLRSPVTSIGVGLELLEGTGADRKVIDSLHEDVEFLGRLIDDLFEIIQLHDRPKGPDKKEELVGEILERAVRSQFPVAETKGVRLEVEATGMPETMMVNGRLLFRLFDNLLRNAIRHGPTGTVVRLSASRVEEGVRFEVTDEGPGLNANPEEIFQRYVSRREGGVGLGLALARQVAEAHGGQVFAKNRETGGACFVVNLPLEEEENSANTQPDS